MNQPIQITLLGTGTSQGIPVIGCQCAVCTSTNPKDKRLRTSAFVRAGSTCVVIDIGPDFRAQMLAGGVDDVHAVLVTHAHNDHVSGLDDIRPINFKHQRDIPVYASAETLVELERRFYYAFDPAYQYPGRPRVHGLPIHENQDFKIRDTLIQPIPVDHGGLDVFGFRFGDIAYITDAKTVPDSSLEKLFGLDVLIINALRFTSHHSHLTVDEAINICEKIQPAKCYLTHISHDMGLHEEVEKRLPADIHLGYDGLTWQSA